MPTTSLRRDISTTPDWRRDAACLGMPLEAFYPTVHTSTAYDAARRACASCPVLAQCAAEMAGDQWGFWAGTTPSERSIARSTPARRWTETDDALIASALSDEEVAARIGRSINAVRLRRSRRRTSSDPTHNPRRRRPHHRAAA